MANDFGKVAVFMGGWSAERNVSLNSGQAVLTALLNQGVDAHGLDVDRNILRKMTENNYDCVFNMLHGRGGEDGVIQGMLDVLKIPYTGSGVLGSALAMDKLRTKQLWKGLDLPTPDYQILNNEKDCQLAVQKLGIPLMIKPVLEGSSIGMSKVNSADDITQAWNEAVKCGGVVIAEKFVEGEEYTAAVLGEKILPMIRLETPRDFYDYKAKYDDNSTQYHCPCGLSEEYEKQLSELMFNAFQAVGANGWGRVDFMLDKDNQPWLIEVNTVPGMTDHSLVPMAARQAGMSFEELVIEILKGAIN
ncbi:MAG: D-alanine--D-alanine ligase [Gammaproteobacteria bacterium]|nr:D-alanine--D-alanine ligase [Gammaproteobacteria bacterium]MCW8909797.1 D-alanine--D-alanine ligase [Gammaproteobacteria bacterium]MCW9005491.1 D-alanine--D-alanine ligase [Gammaproteobacteria bacterium]MCW9055252.1 D-alanine--D-alanine ligase [Gammaproteobacteria bacterium]